MEKMDHREKQNRKVRRRPRVPLQTYKWEDVYRSRRKGGYPWTHLYKEPFDEELDPEEYTMEALRRSKSNSTFDRSERSDGVEIEEIFDDDKSNVSSTKQFMEVAEPDYDSKSDQGASENKMFTIESADSSDNISQYLDKEERGPDKDEKSQDHDDGEGRQARATSEEPPRKRKLSGESSYSKISRLSLPKFATLKKLSKQKFSKISFPTSNIKKSKVPKKASPPQNKKEMKLKVHDFKNMQPEYIHIPLKPPEGETDEFSYLEFEEKRIEPPKGDSETAVSSKVEIGPAPSFRTLVQAIKKAQEQQDKENKAKVDEEQRKTVEDVEVMDFTLQEPEEDTKSEEKLKKKSKDKTKSVDELKKKSEDELKAKLEDELKANSEDDLKTKLEDGLKTNSENDVKTKTDDELKIKPEDKLRMKSEEELKMPEPIIDSFDVVKVVHLKSESERAPAEIVEIIEKVEEIKSPAQVSSPDVDETEPESEMSSNENDPDMFDKLFKADENKENEPISTKPIIREARAKSAEPERKRKMSLESSYSRKSLSKLAFLKKIKDAKNKIKFPSLGNLMSKKQPKEKVKEKIEEPKPSTSKKDKLTPSKPVEPVYIHIPLKPPEGQTDEFSYLENEPLGVTKMEVENVNEVKNAETESPDSVKAEGVQFIFLTAPSDDELLDGPDVPETPLSDSKTFSFVQGVDELKELAKEVVEEISPSPEIKRKILDPVTEEANEDKADEFDKEDGLKITEAEAKSEQIKSSLRHESSPILKKKVSFKRRSKDSKDDEYEEITPKEEVLVVPPILGESATGKEEKVDESSSHFDNTARWSKISDHDYEPVNPPPEEKEPIKPPPKIIEEIPKIDTQNEEIISSPALTLTETEVTTTTHETSLPLFPSSLSFKPHQPAEDLEDNDVPQKEAKPPSALRLKAGQFKTKLQNIKKPKFQKPNLQKLKINLPKIPDTTKINLPSFSLPHRSTTKVTIKERQQSTESNVGDSKKHTFDFKNYSKLFKRHHDDDDQDIGDPSHFTTSEETGTERSKSVERSAGYTASAESQSETNPAATKKFDFSTFPRFFKKNKEAVKEKKPTRTEPIRSRSTEPEVIRIPLHSEDSMDMDKNYDEEETEVANSPSLIRYNQDIDIDDDEYSRENMEIPDEGFKSRWAHGHFSNKVTDLDSPESPNNHNESFDLSGHTDTHSSHSSLDVRRRGVLEEINSDEFFLRQKGISQDNIEVGKYLSSEIREAFKIPVNTLSDLQTDKYDYDLGSNQSLPDVQPKKKPARKPKRKKTPHTSQDEIKYHEYDLDIQPTRPQRNGSKQKNLNLLDEQDIQEIMSRYTDEEKPYYENEKMRGKDQPNIYINTPSEDYKVNYASGFEPAAPPRKHKSLRSLNLSEHESILGDFNGKSMETPRPSNVEDEIDEENRYFKDKYSTYPQDEPILPVRPKRRSKSRKSSQSRSSSQIKSILQESEPEASLEPQPVVEEPCVEEPCVKVLGDYMGYAVIDKSKRDPPLPPPRTPPRRRRSIKSTSQERFATVPRAGPPTRPLRNYSTLSQIKTSRRNSIKSEPDKENVDITQYIEIEDGSRNLVSGEIIKKMKDRPLPAPPRPPRKSRVLKDITSEQNIPAREQKEQEKSMQLEEVDMSTQTEPLSDEFECEVETKPADQEVIRKQIISTPTHYTYEETVTHGSLLVEPLNGAKILRDEDLQVRERVIPVTQDSDDDYPSSIPEDFKLLKDPPQSQPQRVIPLDQPISDLELVRLRVNELHANKIIVSDIESENIQTNQISGKSGVLKISDIELPPSVIQEIARNLPVPEPAPESIKETSHDLQETAISEPQVETREFEVPVSESVVETREGPIDKDVSQEPVLLEDELNIDIEVRESPVHSIISDEAEKKQPPTPPPRTSESLRLQPDMSDDCAPQRPPRQNKTDNSDVGTPMGEPDIDDYPPPRPPQPDIGYIPSQPPASFYALRAQKYVNEDIPAVAPRRRRHQRRISRSSSEDSPVVHTSRKHFRSPEPSIPQLTGQLIKACGSAGNQALKRLIAHVKENIIRNDDGQQDLHVVIIILLVLIAGLLLLGIGDEKTVVHLHHWEYFNPPKDM